MEELVLVQSLMAALKRPGGRVELPEHSRDELPGLFAELGFRQGAEIGVERGYFSERLCQAGQRVYAIDPWLGYPDYVNQPAPAKLERFYREACQRLAPYDCTILRLPSLEAVQHFEDGELDWVYIDGNHSFAYVALDIHFWSQKVRPGGIVAGDDYFNDPRTPGRCQVKYVVDAYVKAAPIKKWYVLGRDEQGPEGKRCPNWLWFQP